MTELSADKREEIHEEQFAFPKQRKEPLEDAAHVRNAIARFHQVEGVTDQEREAAWKRIQTAARRFNIALNEFNRTERKPYSDKK